MNMQPTELTPDALAAIRARNKVNKELEIPHVEYPHCPYCNHIPALLSHADALAAKVARLEGERDAARAVLRDVQWSGEAATCPSCQWDTGDHWIYCELADAIDPDRHDKEDSAHVAHD